MFFFIFSLLSCFDIKADFSDIPSIFSDIPSIANGTQLVEISFNMEVCELPEEDRIFILENIMPPLNSSLKMPSDSTIKRHFKDGTQLLYMVDAKQSKVESLRCEADTILDVLYSGGNRFFSYNCAQDFKRFNVSFVSNDDKDMPTFSSYTTCSDISDVEQLKVHVMRMMKDRKVPEDSWYILSYLCCQEIPGDLFTYLTQKTFTQLHPYLDLSLVARNSGGNTGGSVIREMKDGYHIHIEVNYSAVYLKLKEENQWPIKGGSKQPPPKDLFNTLESFKSPDHGYLLPAESMSMVIDFSLGYLVNGEPMLRGYEVVVGGICDGIGLILPKNMPIQERLSIRQEVAKGEEGSAVFMTRPKRLNILSSKDMKGLSPEDQQLLLEKHLGIKKSNKTPIPEFCQHNPFYESFNGTGGIEGIEGIDKTQLLVGLLAINFYLCPDDVSTLADIIFGDIDSDHVFPVVNERIQKNTLQDQRKIVKEIKKQCSSFAESLKLAQCVIEKHTNKNGDELLCLLNDVKLIKWEKRKTKKEKRVDEIIKHLISKFYRSEFNYIKEVFQPVIVIAQMQCLKELKNVLNAYSSYAENLGFNSSLLGSWKENFEKQKEGSSGEKVFLLLDRICGKAFGSSLGGVPSETSIVEKRVPLLISCSLMHDAKVPVAHILKAMLYEFTVRSAKYDQNSTEKLADDGRSEKRKGAFGEEGIKNSCIE